MSSQQFRDLCKTLLEPKDMALLGLCSLDPDIPGPETGEEPSYARMPVPTSSSFIDAWRAWERALRLHLARYRAQRIKRENGAPVDPPENPLEAAAVAKAAVTLDSPLEAELFLDRARWDAVDALEGFDHFGRNTIFAYFLKLLLMERRSLFRAEEGFAEYKGLYASIAEHASGPGAVAPAGGASTSTESGEP